MDQSRRADGRDDFAEGTGVLNVSRRRIGKVRVIPDIEEVRREAKLVTFRDREVLDQGEVPVLLEWSTVEISPHVAETFGAASRAGVDCARSCQRRVSKGSGGEIIDVDVAIQATVDIARGIARSKSRARSQGRTQGRKRKPISDVGRPCSRIKYGERRPGLRGRDAAD